MICYLPDVRSNYDGYSEIAELHAIAKPIFNDRLEVDFSRCTWFDANMTAPLGVVLGKAAALRYNIVEVVNINSGITNILSRNRFLVSYGYPKIEGGANTTIPFQRMRLTDEGEFANYLQLHLKGKGIPTMSNGMGHRFKQGVFEIFQNALAHSKSSLGVYVCGQFFPSKQRLDLTLADAGVSIPANVRKYLKQPDMPSHEAIRWAFQKGNTTKTGSTPGGVGLKFLKEFIAMNKGRIQIASGQGFYEFHAGEENIRSLPKVFPGTVVTVEINTADTQSYALTGEISPENIF